MTLLEEIAGLLEELELGTYDPDGGEGDILLAAMPDTAEMSRGQRQSPQPRCVQPRWVLVNSRNPAFSQNASSAASSSDA